MRCSKAFTPTIKSHQTGVPIPFYAFTYFLNRLGTARLGFGKKQIRKTDEFLLQGYRHHVPYGQRKSLTHNIVLGQTRTRMSFTDQCMLGKAFLFQQCSTQISVTDVRIRTGTPYFRCIRLKNTDIMKQGRFFDKNPIDRTARQRSSQCKSCVGNLTTVAIDQVVQTGICIQLLMQKRCYVFHITEFHLQSNAKLLASTHIYVIFA